MLVVRESCITPVYLRNAFQPSSVFFTAKKHIDSHKHTPPLPSSSHLLWERLDAVMTLNNFRAVRGWQRLELRLYPAAVCFLSHECMSVESKLVCFLVCIGVYITYVCLSSVFTHSKASHSIVYGLKAFNSYRQEPLAATDQREHSKTLTICSSLTYSSTHGYKIPTHFPFFMHTHKHTHTVRQQQGALSAPRCFHLTFNKIN